MRYDSSGTVPVIFRVRVRDTQGKFSTWSNSFYTKTFPTNVVEYANEKPTQFFLANNYPNPFNPSTTIEFHLPQPEIISLRVFNVLGVEMKSFFSNVKTNAGVHKVEFVSEGLSSGVYFYTLTSPHFTQSKKMILLR
jgi:hypothetical protein